MTFDEGIYRLSCLGIDSAMAEEWLKWIVDCGYTVAAAVGQAWAERISRPRQWQTWTK